MISWTKIWLLTAVGVAGLAVSSTADYLNRPNAPREVAMIKHLSTHLHPYQGENPQEAINYARSVINKVQATGEDFTGLSELEVKIAHADAAIDATSAREDYMPLFRQLSESSHSVAHNNDRTGIILWGTLSSYLLAGMCLAQALMERKKKPVESTKQTDTCVVV